MSEDHWEHTTRPPIEYIVVVEDDEGNEIDRHDAATWGPDKPNIGETYPLVVRDDDAEEGYRVETCMVVRHGRVLVQPEIGEGGSRSKLPGGLVQPAIFIRRVVALPPTTAMPTTDETGGPVAAATPDDDGATAPHAERPRSMIEAPAVPPLLVTDCAMRSAYLPSGLTLLIVTIGYHDLAERFRLSCKATVDLILKGQRWVLGSTTPGEWTALQNEASARASAMETVMHEHYRRRTFWLSSADPAPADAAPAAATRPTDDAPAPPVTSAAPSAPPSPSAQDPPDPPEPSSPQPSGRRPALKLVKP